MINISDSDAKLIVRCIETVKDKYRSDNIRKINAMRQLSRVANKLKKKVL